MTIENIKNSFTSLVTQQESKTKDSGAVTKIYFVTAPHEPVDRGDTSYVEAVMRGINESKDTNKTVVEFVTGDNITKKKGNNQDSYDHSSLYERYPGSTQRKYSIEDCQERKSAVKAIENYIDNDSEHEKSKKILHLQIRQPETGFMINPEELKKMKDSNVVDGIVITCHEWSHAAELDGLEKTLQYFECADQVIFLNKVDQQSAIDTFKKQEYHTFGKKGIKSNCALRKYLRPNHLAQNELAQKSTVSCVPPTIKRSSETEQETNKTEQETNKTEKEDVITFGILRPSKGFEYIPELAQNAKENPDSGIRKFIVCGKINPSGHNIAENLIAKTYGYNKKNGALGELSVDTGFQQEELLRIRTKKLEELLKTDLANTEDNNTLGNLLKGSQYTLDPKKIASDALYNLADSGDSINQGKIASAVSKNLTSNKNTEESDVTNSYTEDKDLRTKITKRISGFVDECTKNITSKIMSHEIHVNHLMIKYEQIKEKEYEEEILKPRLITKISDSYKKGTLTDTEPNFTKNNLENETLYKIINLAINPDKKHIGSEDKLHDFELNRIIASKTKLAKKQREDDRKEIDAELFAPNREIIKKMDQSTPELKEAKNKLFRQNDDSKKQHLKGMGLGVFEQEDKDRIKNYITEKDKEEYNSDHLPSNRKRLQRILFGDDPKNQPTDHIMKGLIESIVNFYEEEKKEKPKLATHDDYSVRHKKELPIDLHFEVPTSEVDKLFESSRISFKYTDKGFANNDSSCINMLARGTALITNRGHLTDTDTFKGAAVLLEDRDIFSKKGKKLLDSESSKGSVLFEKIDTLATNKKELSEIIQNSLKLMEGMFSESAVGKTHLKVYDNIEKQQQQQQQQQQHSR